MSHIISGAQTTEVLRYLRAYANVQEELGWEALAPVVRQLATDIENGPTLPESCCWGAGGSNVNYCGDDADEQIDGEWYCAKHANTYRMLVRMEARLDELGPDDDQ